VTEGCFFCGSNVRYSPDSGANLSEAFGGASKAPFYVPFSVNSAKQRYEGISQGSIGKLHDASPALPGKTWGVALKLIQRNVARLKLPSGAEVVRCPLYGRCFLRPSSFGV